MSEKERGRARSSAAADIVSHCQAGPPTCTATTASLGQVPMVPLPEERHRRRRAEASVLVSQRVFRGLLHLRVGDAVVQSLQPGGEPRGL